MAAGVIIIPPGDTSTDTARTVSLKRKEMAHA